MFFQFLNPLVEIIIITIAINYLLSFFWNTKSMDLTLGAIAFILLLIFVTFFKLPVLHKILIQIGSYAVLVFFIIFQPEMRNAISKLSFRSKKNREITDFDKFLENLTNSVYKLADKRIGGLIAIENEDTLEEYAQKAVILNANFSSELLETIFATTTPLHDGAIIIRSGSILAASVILPLAEDVSQLSKSMGTRHRAGLGLANVSDALVIIISEETGKVSIAREGIMTEKIKSDRFKGIIKSIFNSPSKTFQPKFNLKEWWSK